MPWTQKFRTITSPRQDLEFTWDGRTHVVPRGTHFVEELWPGEPELADIALSELGAGYRVTSEMTLCEVVPVVPEKPKKKKG